MKRKEKGRKPAYITEIRPMVETAGVERNAHSAVYIVIRYQNEAAGRRKRREVDANGDKRYAGLR